MADIHVKGLADLQKFLDQLAPTIERNIMRGALRAGIKPIRDATVANCPVGPPNKENVRLYGGYAGALRDSIRIGTRVKGKWVTSMVTVGGKNRKTGADVFYAHLIEGFWKSHTTSPYPIAAFTKGGFLSIGGLFRKMVMHPPLVAHPFLRPAMDSQAQNAVIAAGEYIKQRLATKQGLDTSAVLIEGDEP